MFSIVYLSSGGYLLQSKRNWNGLEMPTDERRLGEQVGEPAGPAQLHGDVGFDKYLPRKNENRSTPLERKIVTSLISRKNRREKAPFHRLAAERAMPASSTRNELLPTSLSVIAAPGASNLDRKITKEDKA